MHWTQRELSKLLKYSSTRDAAFKRMKNDVAPSEPDNLSNTMDGRADSLASVITIYSVILDTSQAETWKCLQK